MRSIVTLLICTFFVPSIFGQTNEVPPLENGVPYKLAQYRKNRLEQIHYELKLTIPENNLTDIEGFETLEFNLSKDAPIQLDFKQATNHLKSFRINDQSITANVEKEHILLPTEYLKIGKNKVEINFIAGNQALNRREGYLYTLFVPDRARTMFPCFDQPDLKATFGLTLTIPKSWKAIANGKLLDSTINNSQKTYKFAKSDILPTYLFSFAAGIFQENIQISGNRTIELLYRENDSLKINNSLDSIFQLYSSSVSFYEDWTGIKYPFQKNGMVAIPDFQFGGMEHPGAILLQNNTLFLDKNAIQNQLNNRSNLIAHEVAHQWFGDLVTMNWFTDVWMKEVFANYMADKSTGALANKSSYDLKFLTTHYPSAYSVDRTLGSNPIRQKLDNLQDAGMLYGSIIYDKAPIMMRQLELLIGTDNFQKGVRDYLKKYAYSNASWPDLIHCLGKYSNEDLNSWNQVWVNETGRPIINYSIKYDNHKISNFLISQYPEYGAKKNIWKQQFDILFYYKDSIVKKVVDMKEHQKEITELQGYPKPLFVLMNASGLGYGVFQSDNTLMENFDLIKDPVQRASCYIALYENMLNSTIVTPNKLLTFLSSQLSKETTELNLRLISNYINTIYWEFNSPKSRNSISKVLENNTWAAIKRQQTTNNKKILFECFENIFQSQSAYDTLFTIWKRKTPPNSISLNDEDYTLLSLSLALRNNNNNSLLEEQLHRIKNVDRVNRFKIIMQAASSDSVMRNRFFYSLSQKENRQNESAVGSALFYLHHPLRQKYALNYLPKTLELLQEIQKTGAIFFPDNWLHSTFSYYQNPKALTIVDNFIQQQSKDYNPVLKNKILQATDNLRRAQKIVR